MSAYIAGIENKYISRKEGAERVRKTLDILMHLPQGPEATGVSGHQGFSIIFLPWMKHNDLNKSNCLLLTQDFLWLEF